MANDYRLDFDHCHRRRIRRENVIQVREQRPQRLFCKGEWEGKAIMVIMVGGCC
jgi:hypothetical protein